MEKEIVEIDFYLIKSLCLNKGAYSKENKEYFINFNNIIISYELMKSSGNEYIIISDNSISGSRYDKVVYISYYSKSRDKIILKQRHNAQKNNNYDFTLVNNVYKNILLNLKLEKQLNTKEKIKGVKI